MQSTTEGGAVRALIPGFFEYFWNNESRDITVSRQTSALAERLFPAYLSIQQGEH